MALHLLSCLNQKCKRYAWFFPFPNHSPYWLIIRFQTIYQICPFFFCFATSPVQAPSSCIWNTAESSYPVTLLPFLPPIIHSSLNSLPPNCLHPFSGFQLNLEKHYTSCPWSPLKSYPSPFLLTHATLAPVNKLSFCLRTFALSFDTNKMLSLSGISSSERPSPIPISEISPPACFTLSFDLSFHHVFLCTEGMIFVWSNLSVFSLMTVLFNLVLRNLNIT